MERFGSQPYEGYDSGAIFFIPIDKIRVSEEQERKISRDRIERHKRYLTEHKGRDLLPIDANELEDGTFVINGNGRHRFFAYRELGFTTIPLNIKQREGFKPTKLRKNNIEID